MKRYLIPLILPLLFLGASTPVLTPAVVPQIQAHPLSRVTLTLPVVKRAPSPIPVPDAVQPNSIVQIGIDGLTADLAKKCQVLCWPMPKGTIFLPVQDWSGRLSIIFAAPTAGDYLIAIASPAETTDGQVQLAKTVVTVGPAPLPPAPPVPPTPPPVPPPVPPPTPPPVAQPSLLLITAEGSWCEACNSVKTDTLPALQTLLGNRMTVAAYTDETAKVAYPESALVPRWVLTRADGTKDKKVGYLTLDQVKAWFGIGGAK